MVTRPLENTTERMYGAISAWTPIYPTLHQPHCTTCGAPRADLFHCSWNCPKPVAVDSIPNPSLSSWEAVLRVTGLDDQLWLVHRACLEISARGLPDV
ncbi:hypothetical protein HPB51_012410 [Rhipicephalus microplus]|uniref:Uncharacterized protein n=1 Tax=Rhipicephalus microplus TaxID=6941 RepID=A0A9J6E9D6_RHIMP|nr:hypothetical protein HPB51_012410 [Rhipicephalus microplus]